MSENSVWIVLDTSGIGGIETHISLLAHALRDRAIDAEIVLLQDHGPHPMRASWEEAEIPVHTIKGGFLGLMKAMRRQEPALVHTHGYKAGILCRAVCKFLNIPVVSTYHAGEPGVGRIRLYNAFDKALAFGARRIAVSEPIARQISNEVDVVPNFVDVPSVFKYGGETVAFVGRLSHEKGPDRFVEISRALPEMRFEIFGDGPMRQELEETASPNLVFRGAVPTMRPYWDNIGLLCIPSRHEGLPLVALEAMAQGVPAAAFGVGALPDVIDNGRNGFVREPGDVSGLTEDIGTWGQFNLQQRAAMALKAHRRIRENFSSEAVMPEILAVYDDLLAPHAENSAPLDYFPSEASHV